MASKKVSHREWAEMLAKGHDRHELEREIGWDRRLRYLRRHITFPIVIGLCAILLYVLLYDFAAFFQDFLSWVIGITIVTTILAIFGSGRR